MQAEITFPTDTIRRKTVVSRKILSIAQPISKFQKFIEEGKWYNRLLGYERYINRFSWAFIIASIIFFFPFCFNIFVR